jgi:hypothetical protein
MGLLDWWRRLRAKEDVATMERAEEMSVETPEERSVSSGDIEGIAADNEAAERLGEGSTIDEEERLSE